MPPVDAPLLLDIPETIETERCRLRMLCAGDGPRICEAVQESQAELKQWLNWAIPEPTVERFEEFARRCQYRYLQRADFTMSVYAKADGRLLGGCGLHQIQWSVPKCEIGYWLRTSATGQGYATEVVNALTDFAFTYCHMERIAIYVDVANTASAAVARRAGYPLEGTLRSEIHSDYFDAARDSLLFAKSRADIRGG